MRVLAREARIALAGVAPILAGTEPKVVWHLYHQLALARIPITVNITLHIDVARWSS